MKWWPVSESDSSIALGLLCVVLNGFTMPLLFYVAGYFALPTIQKHGISSFIKGKLKRLGIPWIVCTLTICPILPLIYHYTRDHLTLSTSYLDLWIILMKNFAQFNVGMITSMDKLMMNNGFYQRYMWFISLLLLFFFVFSIIYKVKKKWFDMSDPVTMKNPSVSSSLKLLAVVGSLSLFSSAISVLIVLLSGQTDDPSDWFTLGNVIQFQPYMLSPFIIYFGMGIVTYRNKWIERGKFPGHFKTWMISFIVLLIAYLYFWNAFVRAPMGSKAMHVYGFLSFPIYSFLTMSILGFFSSLAAKYWNHPTTIDRNLASNSYNMYLSHYIFVLVFQLILFTIPEIPVLLKFAIVSTSSILCAYLVSQFLIKPFPKLTVVLLSIMLIVMFVVIKP
jgi:hypothetical protein